MIIDPKSNVMLSEGYNGNLRGGTELCGGAVCDRRDIESGTQLEVGCVHAEQNAIYNAARLGTPLAGSWFIVNGEPCRLCAKAIVQVGASKVICIDGGYSCSEGVELLKKSDVEVVKVNKDLSDVAKAIDARLGATYIRPMRPAEMTKSPFSLPT